MTQPAENYIPQKADSPFRKQAVKVWLMGLAVVGVWVLLIILPPLAKAQGAFGVSSPLYSFFSFICHQLPDRSFHIAGEQFGVCSRCFGVYFGLLAGFAVYPLWRPVETVEPLPRYWLFFSLVPIVVDWSLTVFGIWENTQLSRFLTGLILGVACATFIIPAIVEITRNWMQRPAR